MKSTEQSVPRARTEGLLIQELADEVLVYDLLRHRAHCLNQTAATVWKNCNGSNSVGQIAEILKKETRTSVDELVVLMALDQLTSSHLMQDHKKRWSRNSGVSRREVIRRLGTAAAVVLPVVSSIVAPEVVQAATCLGSGQACTTSAQCCSLLCSANTCA